MDFSELIMKRQSCRSFDPSRTVEDDKLMKCIEAAKLAPSAVNDQPYDIWVMRDEKAKEMFGTLSDFNKFVKDCRTLVAFTDAPFRCERLGQPGGSGIDYHAQDVGECIAYFTLQAEELGLATCILGGFDPAKTAEVLGTDAHLEIVIAVGYATPGYGVRKKVRKPVSDNVHFL